MKRLLIPLLLLCSVLAQGQNERRFYRPRLAGDTVKVETILVFPDNTTMSTAASGTADSLSWLATDSDVNAKVSKADSATWLPTWYDIMAYHFILPSDTGNQRTYSNAAYQAKDADLTTMAGLTATTGNMILSAASAWTSATPSDVKTALSLNNVTNESKATMFTSPTFTGTFAAADGTLDGASNTTPSIKIRNFSTTASRPVNGLHIIHGRGTLGSPEVAAAGDDIGSINFQIPYVAAPSVNFTAASIRSYVYDDGAALCGVMQFSSGPYTGQVAAMTLDHTGRVNIPTFGLNGTTITSTGAQVNYLNAATGTTGTTSTNLVFSTSPFLATPTFTGTRVYLDSTGSAKIIQARPRLDITASAAALYLRGQDAATGSTDKNGGNLFLRSGISTGNGTGTVVIQSYGGGESGTAQVGATQNWYMDNVANYSGVDLFSNTGAQALGSTGQRWAGLFTTTANISSTLTFGSVVITTDGNELNYVDGVTSAIQTQLNAKTGYTYGAGEPTGGSNGDKYWDTTGLYFWVKSGDAWRQQP